MREGSPPEQAVVVGGRRGPADCRLVSEVRPEQTTILAVFRIRIRGSIQMDYGYGLSSFLHCAFTSVFKDKKLLIGHRSVDIKVSIFCWLMEGSGSDAVSRTVLNLRIRNRETGIQNTVQIRVKYGFSHSGTLRNWRRTVTGIRNTSMNIFASQCCGYETFSYGFGCGSASSNPYL
jgi:hypothetical protein